MLFRNRNIEKIVFFLFVNETCYGSQLQRLLRLPLTPIQKALIQLEEDGILASHYEGKKRIYQFHPLYPLRWELEAFLKKAYSLLPIQEKKQYCLTYKYTLNSKGKKETPQRQKKELRAFWERLLNVQKLFLTAKSKDNQLKTIKTGQAEITPYLSSPSILTFQEKGYWFIDQYPETNFSNAFRWTLDTNTCLITLEHLRYGTDRPVFLFNLIPIENHKLVSVDAYLCGKDVYLGNISWNLSHITLHWRIIGPHKNEELVYQYSSS